MRDVQLALLVDSKMNIRIPLEEAKMRDGRLELKNRTSESCSYHLMAKIVLRSIFFIFIFGLHAIICISGCNIESQKPPEQEIRKTTDKVVSLIAELKDDNYLVRDSAATNLGKIGDTRAVEPLIAALKDKDYVVRISAAKALDKIGWQAYAEKEKIAYYIAKQNWVECLKIGKPAVESFIALLKDNAWTIRCTAANALGWIGDTRAVEPLIPLLKDKNIRVRKNAAQALVKMKDHRGVPALVNFLKDWNEGREVANELREIGWQPQSINDKVHYAIAMRDKSILTSNWEQTKSVLLEDVLSNEYRVIENALYAFIGIGNQEIIPALINTLNSKGNKTMAEAYLNCGHNELDYAARAWAARNGYTITAGSGAAPVGWGALR